MSDRENRRMRERWELGCAGGLEARLHCAERWGAERPVCIAQLRQQLGFRRLGLQSFLLWEIIASCLEACTQLKILS